MKRHTSDATPAPLRGAHTSSHPTTSPLEMVSRTGVILAPGVAQVLISGVMLQKVPKMFGRSENNAYLCQRIQTPNIMKQKINTSRSWHPAEVLTFRHGDLVATIATNGSRHVTQVGNIAQEHLSLNAAICHLECRGYAIVTNQFQAL